MDFHVLDVHVIPAPRREIKIRKLGEILTRNRNALFKAGETSNSLAFILIRNIICPKTTSNIGGVDSGEEG